MAGHLEAGTVVVDRDDAVARAGEGNRVAAAARLHPTAPLGMGPALKALQGQDRCADETIDDDAAAAETLYESPLGRAVEY